MIGPEHGRSRMFVLCSRKGCFDCAEIGRINLLVQILLHSSPPVDIRRTGKTNLVVFALTLRSLPDLMHVQRIKSMGNRQTFHPKNLDYDIFNIEIDIGPVDLLVHGLLLRKLWWLKVKHLGTFS